ncbi:helix-turn-helix transcriptional regulator [Acinetobacter gyllenbergii]|uniref:helix-turn-helix transcriptional regulator n=1 Tax=Acinetobacter gyllenbergii TaxID=134534 RepID=UPI00241CADB3|nr:helix-turn-helix transcriptional regulator [Acinetobacter gyllenbergii]
MLLPSKEVGARKLLEEIQNITSIEVLGHYLLKLGKISKDHLASEFIRQSLQELKTIICFNAAWWGLITHDKDKKMVGIHHTETINLPTTFPSEWKAVANDDEFAHVVDNLSDIAHRFSYSSDFQDETESHELNQFSRKYQLLHGMSMSIKDTFTGHIFFISLYRHSGASFSNINIAFFEQSVRHINQIWRYNLQEALELSPNHNMFHAGLVREDGYILSIGAGLCEVIYAKWPEWKGVYIPEELMFQFDKIPTSIRLGKVNINIFKKSDNIRIEILNIKRNLTLSPREYRVAYLFSQGHSYKKVAELLGLSPSTVRTYLQKAYMQLGVSNKVELIKALHIISS